MSKVTIVFDQASARHYDVDGRLHVDKSNISKAMVSPYYGKEIPNSEGLNLDPNKIYRLLRCPVELEKGASTFNNLQILSKHVPVNAEDPEKDVTAGSIGSDVRFESPYLVASLCVWDAEAIAGIETKKIVELSCGYRYVPVMEPGEFEGQPYDGRMTEIQGNHLALVEVGRAGSDVVVADHQPFKKETITMRMTKLGKALYGALRMASPKLAQDSALPALVGMSSRSTFNKSATIKAILAMDEDISPEDLDSMLDAVIGVEEPQAAPAAVGDDLPDPGVADPMAAPAAPSIKDQILALLTGKVDDALLGQIGECFGQDEADPEDEKMVKESEMVTAMDGLRKELRELTEAVHDVRPIVGDVIGLDSAESVYRFALDHLGVDHEGVSGVRALKALINVANKKQEPAPRMANDGGAAAVKQWPNLSRFSQA